MKPTYTLLPDFAQSPKSFVVKKIARSYFATDFHFHSECQLVYVLSGSGTRIIGDSIERFDAGDLTFVGPNAPHVWYSEPVANERPEAVSLALYINPSVVCKQLDGLIDTTELRLFFAESERGIRIADTKKSRIRDLLQRMPTQKDVALLASFLSILNELLDEKDLVWLNGPNLLSSYSRQAPNRFHKLMDYIQQNFREEITLKQAASVAGLEVHSFCRYFKWLTHRTFSDFVNEVRIGFASKLLVQSDRPVTQIALDSGYPNLSYFNRSFKKINKMPPRAYRNLHQAKTEMSQSD